VLQSVWTGAVSGKEARAVPGTRWRKTARIGPTWGKAGERVLAIDLLSCFEDGCARNAEVDVLHVGFADLTPETFRLINPDVVASPLFRPEFDALDVLHFLKALKFGGRLLVIAHGLPNPRAVLTEIRKLRGSVTVDLHSCTSHVGQ
jgi:hypothetical protein